VTLTRIFFSALLVQFATSAYGQSVTFSWDRNTEANIAGYNIYRSDQLGKFSSLPMNGPIIYTSNAFTDINVSHNRTYYYVVTAVTTTGVESVYSNPIQATLGHPSLAGYWQLDEGAGNIVTDSSGMGNIGVLMNGAGWTTGKSGAAVGFNGIEANIDLGNPAALQITGAMSVSAWVQPNSIRNNGRIVSKSGGLGLQGWSLNVEDYNVFEFSIAADQNTYVFVDSTTPVPLQTWVHLVGVYEPGSAVRIYINGVLNNSVTSKIPIRQHNPPVKVHIGGRAPGLQGKCTRCYFDGKVNDVRIYNRALYPSEVQFLHHSFLANPLTSIENVEFNADFVETGSNPVDVEAGDIPSADIPVAGLAEGVAREDAPIASVLNPYGLTESGRIYATIQDSVNTGITFINPNTEPVTIDFYFTDENGEVVHTDRTVIEPDGNLSGFLSEPPFTGPAPISWSSVRTFTFSASAPLAVTAARISLGERSHLLMSPIAVASLNSHVVSPISFPYYAEGAGWQTEIQLVNATDSTLAGVVRFVPNLTGSDGDFRYEIPPRSAIALKTVGTGVQPSSGWVRVIPSPETLAPSGTLLLSFRENDITTSQAAIFGTTENAPLYVYAETFGTGPGMPGSAQTGLVISNPGLAPAHLSLVLLSLDGEPTERRGHVTVGAQANATLFLDQIPGLEDIAPFRGYLQIEGAPTAVVGLKRSYTAMGDSLIVPMPAMADSSLASLSERIRLADEDALANKYIEFNSVKAVVLP
jgi:hypothetical protein